MRFTTLRPGVRTRRGARRSRSAVALEIGADAVVALHTAVGDDERLRRAIVHPLPLGLVVDGEVTDPEGLAEELSALFGEHQLPRDVRVGLAHPRLMVRLVELPATLEGEDLDHAVRHLATDLLPVDLDKLVVDYRRVGHVPREVGGDLQRILMAAARVDGIDRLARALAGAGLRPEGIALSGLAMVSALEHPPLPGKAILYVQAGALTSVVITEDGQPLLVRAASAGSEWISARLAERARISHEAARAHVSSLGLAPPAHHVSSLGLAAAAQRGVPAPIPGELEASVAQQVREGLRRIVAEVQSSRGVYAARPGASPIGAVVLTGSMTTWPGVARALEDELHLPVLVAARESWPQLDGLEVAPQRLDVVIGLGRTSESARPDLRTAAILAGRDSTQLIAVARVACAMLAVLAAATVYLVVISNQIRSDRAQLGRISTGLAIAERQAAELKPYDDFAKATLARHDAVAAVARTRFNWDRTLTELAEVAPAGVWLTSAKGTLTPTTDLQGGSNDAPTAGLRGALPGPALELAGCAEREGMVPSYIDRLHAMTGVTEVGFSRSERLEKGGNTKDRARARVGGDCRNGDTRTARFALVTYFKASATAAVAAIPGARTDAGAAAPPAPAAAPEATPPAAPEPTASAPTGGSR